VSLLKHLEAVEQAEKKAPPQLLEFRSTSCPEEMVEYWYDFLEIRSRIPSSENGPNPIDFVQYTHWANINQVNLTTLHQDIIFGLDSIWMNVQYDNMKKNMPKGKGK
jgi:hypothetical protein